MKLHAKPCFTQFCSNWQFGAGDGKLCVLLQWHIQDPVDSFESRRNNRIYEWQQNRNPFIDNPQWAQSIYGASCGL